ncbi:MAG: hypothetical protein EOO82_01915 [Oxalobacteraceae bacterium]|nr:MAG: hypothetical protein EOO82_01915 [Oxalobacteraceae bacterium]
MDIERFQKQFTSPHMHNAALQQVLSLFNWAIRMQKIIRRRRDYTTEQIKKIATYIFYPVMEVPPETDHLDGFAKRDMALAKGRITSANDQMQELSHYMGILFLTMARPSDLNNAEFDHFDLDKLVWHKHNTKGIKLSRSLYEYSFRTVPIHPKVADMVRA